MNVAEALQVLGLPPSTSKASAEAAIRDQYRLWSNRVATAPTAAARAEAQTRVDRIGQARQALRDWDGAPVGPSRPTPVATPPPFPHPTERPKWPERPIPPRPTQPVPRNPAPPVPPPRPSGIPGWMVNSDHRWVCTPHEMVDCLVCFHPGRDQKTPPSTQRRSKSKGAAFFLAVFFGPFTWLYTYQRDSRKFWINFVFILVTGGIWFGFVYIYVLIEWLFRPNAFYDNYPTY